jgi:hypothetical protein
MGKITESSIENFAIKLFEQLGYSYVYAPDIAPDGENPERSHYDEVILKDRLWSAVRRINPSVPCHALHSPRTIWKYAARASCWTTSQAGKSRKSASRLLH